MHLCVHFAWIYGKNPKPELLCSEGPRKVVQSGLRCAVESPVGVRLYGGIRADENHCWRPRIRSRKRRKEGLREPEWTEEIRFEDILEVLALPEYERAQRNWAKRAGTVDEHVDGAHYKLCSSRNTIGVVLGTDVERKPCSFDAFASEVCYSALELCSSAGDEDDASAAQAEGATELHA